MWTCFLRELTLSAYIEPHSYKDALNLNILIETGEKRLFTEKKNENVDSIYVDIRISILEGESFELAYVLSNLRFLS